MRKTLLTTVLAVLLATTAFAQSKSFWAPVSEERAKSLGEIKESFIGVTGNLFQLDVQQLKQTLASAPQRSSAASGIIVAIPNIDGEAEHYRMYEAPNFAPELQAQYTGIRSYVGYGIEDPTAQLRMSVSHANVQTMVLRADSPTEFIEPYTKNAAVYSLFSSGMRKAKGQIPFTCFQENADMDGTTEPSAKRNAMSSEFTFRTYRLALSCTAEYTNYHGGTVADALAAMNATITRVNGVYERDLAVRLEIIPNNTAVIYTNAATDPYSNAGQGSGGAWSPQLQDNLDETIGSANYDIGHLFGASGGGGFAGCIGCICDSPDKGSGFTSPGQGGPEGDSFDIDYVAHEMGHQLGANHTYSVADEGTGVNIEPGSGSTIMGYAGITGPVTDIQSNSDDYFTWASIDQIQENLANKPCAVETAMSNPNMTINAGPDYTIPKGTPFILKGTNTAANPAGVTYTWEQNDDVTGSSVTGNNSVVSPTKTSGPTFRSLPPTTSPNRYMPALTKVLNNTLTGGWETVSNVARTLNFTLTGRDNIETGGRTETDAMKVFVKSTAGPFKVTSQNTANTMWPLGSSQTVTWDVAGTTGNGISTANVNILLSTDGGQTFSTVLAANTPNDGSQVITAPNIPALSCRIMVEAAGNIYYALNQAPFAIGYTVTTACNTYTNSNDIAIPDGGNQFTTSVINVPANTTISDVNVSVNISHSYIGDLTLVAVSPDNTQVLLWQQQCDSSDNLNVTFNDNGSAVSCGNPTTGNIMAQGTLSDFNGESAQGSWILGFIDQFQQDAGTLTSWSVEICSQTAILATNEFGLTDFTVYPNPNAGNFTVAFSSESAQDVNIQVHDIRGRQIYNANYPNGGLFSGNVNLASAETGVYLVTVMDGARKEVRKIVVN